MADEVSETPPENDLVTFPQQCKEAEDATLTATTDDVPKLPDAPLIPLKNIPTLLGELRERCVTVCIDTSGSMYKCIDAVKEHVIEALVQKAHKDTEAMFNVMEFSTGVTQWADRLVRCTPQTVAVAAQWINSLSATTGTDTLDALLTAFADPVCDAVYLITDGLPDKPTSEILDHVSYASDNRPVHCYYVQSSQPDSAATSFLQDLAVETFGSFHVITVTEHGAIERITPVYHAEVDTHPSVIRSTNGTIYANQKYVTVAATLDTTPNIHVVRPPMVVGTPPSTVFAPTPPTVGVPAHYYPWYPHSNYYYPHYPQYGWSRYRPARAWGTRTEQMVSTVGEQGIAPGAGVLLVGQKVLVRRHQDGFYYIGTVKSQILEDKFLVELGPCKHGKYKESIFQETYVYDIIAHVDALRHTVLTGDKVLAPMEPDGERYGPGVVIDGQEKRYAEGNSVDCDLTVTFHDNGGTQIVPRGMTVWIPPALHDRVTFEQQLPAKVRRDIATKESYPEDNWPGYPTSGPIGQPQEYEKFEPVYVEKTDSTFERGLYKSPHYVPLYPTWYKHGARPSTVTSEEMDSLIPGTDFTKTQLNEKVMSQLMEHKMTLDGSRKEQELADDNHDEQRLLKKRQQFQEKSILKDSRKSVTFQDLSDAEAEADPDDLEARDSGHGSSNDLLYDSDFDLDYDYEYKSHERSRPRTRDKGIGTDWRGHVMYTRRRSRSLSPTRRSRSVSPDKRPPWRYWGNDPAPDIIDPPNHEPYDQTYTAAPIEVREALRGKHGVEWTSSHTKVVDPFARHRYDSSVRDSLYIPKPPTREPPEKQGPGEDIGEILGARMSDQIRREELRKNYKRNQALRRQRLWNEKTAEELNQQHQMDDQHRGLASSRINRHKQNVQEELDRQQLRQDVKRTLQRQTQERLAEYCNAGKDREEKKYEALRARRELREAGHAARQREVEEGLAKRQFIRESQAQSLWQQHQAHLNNEEAGDLAREQQHQRAKINRIRHFRALESEGQRRKVLQTQVSDQQTGILRSQIFP